MSKINNNIHNSLACYSSFLNKGSMIYVNFVFFLMMCIIGCVYGDVKKVINEDEPDEASPNLAYTGEAAVMKRLYDESYVSIERGIRLNFTRYDDRFGMDIPGKEAEALVDEINRFLWQLTASDFEEYYDLLTDNLNRKVALSSIGRHKFYSYLIGLEIIGEGDEVDDETLHELYWNYATNVGGGSKEYKGVSIEKTGYRTSMVLAASQNAITSPFNMPDIFPEEKEVLGWVGQPTAFVWNDNALVKAI